MCGPYFAYFWTQFQQIFEQSALSIISIFFQLARHSFEKPHNFLKIVAKKKEWVF